MNPTAAKPSLRCPASSALVQEEPQAGPDFVMDAQDAPASDAEALPVLSTPLAASAPSELENIWTQLVEATGRVSPFMKTYLLESHPVSINKTLFTIGFDPEFKDHQSLVDTPKNRTILETKMHEMGHHGISVRFVQAEAPAHRVRPVSAPAPETAQARSPSSSARSDASAKNSPGAPASAPSGPVILSKEEFKNDPLIKKALEIFKGTIVEVRA
jgi:hypothetical protein